MKNFILLFIGFCLISMSPLQAQQGFKLGILGGPQLGYAFNESDQALPLASYERVPKWGAFGGIMIGGNFIDAFGLQLQLIYSQQGNAYITQGGQNGEVRSDETLDYFKIPLLLSYNTPTLNSKIRFSIQAGPQVSFLTRAQQYIDDPSLELLPDQTLTRVPATRDVYEPVVWGLLVEPGIDIDLDPFVLTLRVRQDVHLQDQENKDTSVRVSENGSSSIFPYWNFFRGPLFNERAVTTGWATGLRIGLVYTFQ